MEDFIWRTFVTAQSLALTLTCQIPLDLKFFGILMAWEAYYAAV